MKVSADKDLDVGRAGHGLNLIQTKNKFTISISTENGRRHFLNLFTQLLACRDFPRARTPWPTVCQQNATGTAPESCSVPYVCRRRSARVPQAFHMRSVCVSLVLLTCVQCVPIVFWGNFSERTLQNAKRTHAARLRNACKTPSPLFACRWRSARVP